MHVGGLVGGIALGVGAGVGAGVAMHKVLHKHHFVTPEVKQGRSTGDPAGDAYTTELPWIFSFVAGAGAVSGGVVMLQGSPALKATAIGVGLLGLGGMIAGGLLGGGIGAVRGSAAAHEAYDPSIADDVDELLLKYDRNKDGAISLEHAPGELPEYMVVTGAERDHHRGISGMDSIEQLAERADVDGNRTASRQELVDLLATFDTSGNGKLTDKERFQMVTENLHERH